MRTISLFTGCGGMDIGAERAGAEIVFANDVMPEAAETYKAQFPDVPFVAGDIGDVATFPSAELVVGGYPCQSFSLGGRRTPEKDERTQLYRQFARCVDLVNPKFFVAENVKGLKSLKSGHWLQEQLALFEELGVHGYNVSWALLQAQNYGVPQRRKRVFIVGVRRDLGLHYWFPEATHGNPAEVIKYGLLQYSSHGDAIAGLPLWPAGEFYERPHDPEGHMSWYYMSRNRKADWDEPSFTVVANFRHVTLHPASSTMRLVWSDLKNGWKQKWEFTGEFEHRVGHPERPVLEVPRRLSWRECALIQTLPADLEPVGNLERKFEQIGNAVPPRLVEAVVTPLLNGSALRSTKPIDGLPPEPLRVTARRASRAPSDLEQIELVLSA
jgi:DNA (cytosine-5)-methyltransferase 1